MKRSIKDAAKKGQKDVCIILAKEIIQSKRAINKLYASKAQMNSVLLSMKNQLGEYSCCASSDPTATVNIWCTLNISNSIFISIRNTYVSLQLY